MNEQLNGLGGAAIIEPALEKPGLPFALVTGGKGGVGKSSIALNMAIEMGRRGQRVLLLDLDLGLGDLAVMLKLSPKRTIEDFFRGTHSLLECCTLIESGVHLVPAGSGSGDLARPDSARRAQLFAELANVTRHFDVVIADSAAGIGPDVLAFATAADCVVCVATADPASITDAYGIIKALDHHGHRHSTDVPTPGLVMNRVSTSSEAYAIATRLAGITARFLSRRPRLLGWLPDSNSVRQATRAQRAFVSMAPKALSSQNTARLAQRVETLLALQKT